MLSEVFSAQFCLPNTFRWQRLAKLTIWFYCDVTSDAEAAAFTIASDLRASASASEIILQILCLKAEVRK